MKKYFFRPTKNNIKGFNIKNGLGFFMGFIVGIGAQDFDKKSWYEEKVEINNLGICFTPPSGCGELIAREVFHAKNEVLVQAFSITSDKIVKQLINAKKRGVKVEVMIDRLALDGKGSKVEEMRRAQIPVTIDSAEKFAHNKVIIIDQQKVITGSFNFTNSAENKNAENVVLINNKEVAKKYIKNWKYRYGN